jgi:plastocyanin
MTVARAIVAALVLGGPAVWATGTGGIKGAVTDGRGEPVRDAVVMVDGPSAPAAAGAAHAVMDQRRDTFVPHVLAVPVGTTIDFPNHDPRLHNVYSTSPAKKFDLGMYGEGETKSVVFDAPGVVRVLCNVHPKMEAFVVVHANPWVAVTDARGSYTITGVPAGQHRVRVWHEGLPETERGVTVHEGQVETVDVRVKR